MDTIRPIRRGVLTTALMLALTASAAHAVDAPTTIEPKINVTGLLVTGTYDRFIIRYRDGSNERSSTAMALRNIQAAISRAGMDRTTAMGGRTFAPLKASHQRKLALGADLVRTSRKLSQGEALALMQQIAADPAVEHVEPDLLLRHQDAAPVVPSDPRFATFQWHMRAGDGTMEKVGSDADAYANLGGANVARAWNLADGDGITVAVLDTGITRHSDLDLSLADAGYDFIIDKLVSGRAEDGRVPGAWDTGSWTTEEPWLSECTDADNPPEDSSWHGTHVAGTVAELANSQDGLGVANKAKLLPVRVLGHCGGYTSDINDAIVWASGGHVDGVPDNAHPAQVINLSLGGGGQCTSSTESGKAIADAISRGTTVVVAAGNSNADMSRFSPASCPGAIAVASNGITGKRAYYSNWGNGVALSAPGGGVFINDIYGGDVYRAGFVWSTGNRGTKGPEAETFFGMAGTSQAAPHVAGVVALMLSAQKTADLPLSTPAQIRSLLTSTARPFPVALDHPMGAGIVDAYAAVRKAANVDGPEEEPAIPLVAGATLSGQGGAAGTSKLYALVVPAGARNLNLRSFGGSGDVSLMVKAGSAPAADGSNADFKSSRPGNTETVVIATPQETTYYIRVVGQATYANLSVLGVYR